MMTTPDKLRADAAKLDVFLEMFVKALNNVQFQLKPGEVHALMGEMEEFAGHMEVCNAIFAVNFANREAEKGGAV